MAQAEVSMKHAHNAVIFVSRNVPAMVDKYANHGNPKIRQAAETMAYIRGMYEQETARQHQAADDALYYLPMDQIEECIRTYMALR